MVWHAFLLNPEDYKQACASRKLDSLYRVAFPWKEIVSPSSSSLS